MDVVIYTDGSCSINNKTKNCLGGFAYLIIANGVYLFSSGCENTTNNRMELKAVIESLRFCLNNSFFKKCSIENVVIYTDSKYVCSNYDSLESWVNNNWKGSKNRDIANKDLWMELCEIIPEFHNLKFKWVKGHSNNQFNKIVDRLAKNATKLMKERLKSNS